MKAYDVVGYVSECEIFCSDCGNPELDRPIFAYSEADFDQFCSECGSYIPTSLCSREGKIDRIVRRITSDIESSADCELTIAGIEIRIFQKGFDFYIDASGERSTYGLLDKNDSGWDFKGEIENILEGIEDIHIDDDFY